MLKKYIRVKIWHLKKQNSYKNSKLWIKYLKYAAIVSRQLSSPTNAAIFNDLAYIYKLFYSKYNENILRIYINNRKLQKLAIIELRKHINKYK